MAYFHVEMFSNVLHRSVGFQMSVPNDVREGDPILETAAWKRGMKTLFLLHGYTGSAGNWGLDHLARQYNVALVMPSGENAFYLDAEATGHQYATFVGVELVNYLRKTFGLAMRPEDTFVMGMSMGGFGALHTALAYPQTFGKAAGMSSALIVHGIAHMKPDDPNPVANYAYYRECFGDLEKVEESDANPETLVKKLQAAGRKLPDIYMCCGTEDFLLENNRAFHHFLEERGVAHEYHESKGGHDGIFWDEYSPKAIAWMMGEE